MINVKPLASKKSYISWPTQKTCKHYFGDINTFLIWKLCIRPPEICVGLYWCYWWGWSCTHIIHSYWLGFDEVWSLPISKHTFSGLRYPGMMTDKPILAGTHRSQINGLNEVLDQCVVSSQCLCTETRYKRSSMRCSYMLTGPKRQYLLCSRYTRTCGLHISIFLSFYHITSKIFQSMQHFSQNLHKSNRSLSFLLLL